MASTKTASTTKYDSKSGVSGAKNYVKVTVLVETQKGRYASKADTAKDVGVDVETWLEDSGYDGQYSRFRVLAETLKESEFDAAYNA